MSFDKTFLVRNLVPKSYHFDGYNELMCQNSRDRPFFADNHIPMGNYFLTTHLSGNILTLQFSSVCYSGKISFKPYSLEMSQYVNMLQKAIQTSSDFITFEIVPVYDITECRNCNHRNHDCNQLYRNLPHKVFAAVSFNTAQVEEALASYFEIKKPITGGKSTMKNTKNMFGMELEFGVSKDHNVSSTLMGVAVKNSYNGNWMVYDRPNNRRKNIAGMKMGDFPVFLLPTKALVPGDLIKMNGSYLYVQSVNENNTITAINAANGVIQEMLPDESLILGMPIFTKVVAFDAKTLTEAGSSQNVGNNVLAAICMMQWSNGSNDEFSLDNINDGSFNGLGSCLPLILASGNTMGGLFTGADGNIDISKLVMMGAMTGGDSDSATQMLVLSQLLGGGNTLLDGISATGSTPQTDKVTCPTCNATYPAGTNFCSKCGTKTTLIAPTCQKCGTVLNSGAMFCHHCGTKVGNDECPKCGNKLTDGAHFCSSCGHNLTEPSAAAVADNAPDAKE